MSRWLKSLLGVQTDSEFLPPGPLIDDDLELKLMSTTPGEPEKGFVPYYSFQMRPTGQNISLGGIRLRISNNDYIITYAGHIGYNVREDYRGHHYAARSVILLKDLAKRHGLDPMWITCNPDNIASSRSCELAGGIYVETVDVPEGTPMYNRGETQKMRYRFDLS